MEKKLKNFPILHSSGPKTVPAKFVYAHSAQAERNHSQTVDRLAERGGLDWTELFAVLHDVRYSSMNVQEAMDLCLKKMEDPYEIMKADRLQRIETQANESLDGWTDANRTRCVWLNLADGTFSQSWPSEEHPPAEVIAANYTLAGDSMYKLIEYRCVNQPAFAFDIHMKLR